MTLRELIQRYAVFALGIVFTTLGITVTTSSMLGTSPISAIPYSLSMAFPALTLGNWTIIFNILLTIAQVCILRKNTKKVEVVLQILATIPFGYVIDFWQMILVDLNPQMYLMRLLVMLLGCAIVAFGVYLQVMGGVIMLPGDVFVRAISKVTQKEFGKVRMISDISMSITAFAIVLIFTHGLSGMREGTIIAAFLVGNIVSFYRKRLTKLEGLLLRGCKYN